MISLIFIFFSGLGLQAHEATSIHDKIELLEKKALSYERLLEATSEKEFIRIARGDFACDAQCVEEIRNWRKSMILYVQAFKRHIPNLVRSSGSGLKQIYEKIWQEAFYYQSLRVGNITNQDYVFYFNEKKENLKKSFLHSLGDGKEFSRSQGIRLSSYVAQASGQYNAVTAGSMIGLAATTWLPWTAVTEGVEFLFLGPFHVFCQASQLLYLEILRRFTHVLDRGAHLASFRPLEINPVRKMILAYQFQRVMSGLKKQSIPENPMWLKGNREFQRLRQGMNVNDLARLTKEIYQTFENAYFNMGELRQANVEKGKLSNWENMKSQFSYRRRLRHLREGIHLVLLEAKYQNKITTTDIDYLRNLILKTQKEYAKDIGQQRGLRCSSLFG